MSLICTGNRIQLTDSVDDRIAFDTDRSMFHTLTFLSGTIARPSRSNLDTSVDIDQSTVLASVNSNCTHVFGWCQPDFASAQDAGVKNLAWHAVGGTIILFMSPGDRFSTEYRFASTTATTLTHLYAITFKIASNQAQLEEQIFFMRINSADAGVGDIIGFQAFDLNYKLWCGAFDA